MQRRARKILRVAVLEAVWVCMDEERRGREVLGKRHVWVRDGLARVVRVLWEEQGVSEFLRSSLKCFQSIWVNFCFLFLNLFTKISI